MTSLNFNIKKLNKTKSKDFLYDQRTENDEKQQPVLTSVTSTKVLQAVTSLN